jgi:hypothetical protein
MTTKLEYKGQWRLPNSSEYYHGTLRFDPVLGSELELFGTFNDKLFDRTSKELILGTTTNGDITLIDNWYRHKSSNVNGVIISVYRPNYILIGQHIEKNEEIEFSEVKFSLLNLFQWLDRTGIDFNSSKGGYAFVYDKIDEIEFNLHANCKGKISFNCQLESESFYNKYEFKEQAYITLKYNNSLPFSQILKDVNYINGFITLVTFEQSYPIEIIFKDEKFNQSIESFNERKPIKCFYQTSLYNLKHKLRYKQEHLVKYKDIETEFEHIIKDWYSKHLELESVFYLMLNSFKEKNLFSEDKFMDNARAIESYHRRTHNNQIISEKDYSNKINKILSEVSLCEEDLEWLANKLKYGNEPSLSQRIKELIKENQNSYIKKRIPSTKKFSRQVVEARNYYTHYDDSSEKNILKSTDLFYITQKIMGLLYSCIFKEIGINAIYYEKGLESQLYE